MPRKEVAIGIAIIALILSFIALGFMYWQSQSLKALIAKQNEELSKLTQKLGNIEKNLAGNSGKIESIGQEVSNVANEVSSMKSNVSNVVSNLQNVKSGLNSMQGSVKELSNTMKSVSAEVESLAEKLASVTSNVTSLQKQITVIQKQVETIRYPLTLTDALGRQVTIPSKPQRIVSTAPSITEILFLVGAGSNVVGVDKFSNYPPVVKELIKNGTIKVVGGFSTLNIEAILMLKPDIVFMTTGVQERYAKELAGMGITVFVLPTRDMSDVFSDILTVGLITGHFDKALKAVEEMRNIITSTRLKVEEYLNKTGGKPVKVYYEIYPDYWTIGRTSFINDIITLAGGDNIFENETTPYFVASSEAIITANPDVILMNYNYGYFGSVDDLIKRITSREGWANITAVKEGRIYVFSGVAEDIMVRPGPRAALAIALMARVLYPQAFGITVVPHNINETVMQEWGIPTSLG